MHSIHMAPGACKCMCHAFFLCWCMLLFHLSLLLSLVFVLVAVSRNICQCRFHDEVSLYRCRQIKTGPWLSAQKANSAIRKKLYAHPISSCPKFAALREQCKDVLLWPTCKSRANACTVCVCVCVCVLLLCVCVCVCVCMDRCAIVDSGMAVLQLYFSDFEIHANDMGALSTCQDLVCVFGFCRCWLR